MHDNLTLRRLMQDLPDDSPFYRLYRHFMWKVLAPTVGQPLSYSSHPKMRVHLPDTPSVSSFHSDVPVTKRIDQVNLWMPFTDVDDTATLWLESFYRRGDYAPFWCATGSTHLRRRLSQPRVGTQPHADHQGQPGHGFCRKGATTRAEGVDLINRLAARLRAPGKGTADQSRRVSIERPVIWEWAGYCPQAGGPGGPLSGDRTAGPGCRP